MIRSVTSDLYRVMNLPEDRNVSRSQLLRDTPARVADSTLIGPDKESCRLPWRSRRPPGHRCGCRAQTGRMPAELGSYESFTSRAKK